MPPKKETFQPPKRIETDFRRDIDRWLLKYLNFRPGSTLSQITERLTNLVRRSDFLEGWATIVSRRMVTQTRAVNARSWKAAAMEGSRGREIYEALKHELKGPLGLKVNELISSNAKLISSIPSELAESVAKEIARAQQRGLRPEAIAERLRIRIPQLSRSRVKMIARTESSKAASALTEARSMNMGVPAYEWSTSHDVRVRLSHRKMEGVLVFWNDPPSPEAIIGVSSTLGHYHAGNCPNCRCVPLPIISLDEVSWPARVYRHGAIQMMSRSRFSDLLKTAA